MKTRMKTIAVSVLVGFFALNLSACTYWAHKDDKIQKQVEQQPVNCAAADSDIKVLKSEKTRVGEQIAMGLSSIIPIGAVVGILSLTEVEKVKIAVGDYNKKIDEKIAEIKQKCNVE